MLFGIRFCKVLCGLIWLLYGLNHIWFDDSSFKFICPQGFESGLLQFVITKLKIRPREPAKGETSSYGPTVKVLLEFGHVLRVHTCVDPQSLDSLCQAVWAIWGYSKATFWEVEKMTAPPIYSSCCKML